MGTEAEPDLPLASGEVLEGKYRVGRPVGGGAMGVVFEGQHVLLDKAVAIKVLRAELAADAEQRDRFAAEARAAAAIGHPNIVPVTDLGRTPSGALYFVMDRLKGETLRERLDRVGRLSPAETVAIAEDVLAGLEAAHALGLIHRDLKPDNVFLAARPGGKVQALLLDFGVAKALAQVGKRAHETRAGYTVGTPHYMAPEQAAAVPDLDGRSDLYSLGVMLYQCLAGRPPFQGDDALEVLRAVLTSTPPKLATLASDAPPALVAAIERAMSFDRKDRPASAGELARLLAAAVKGGARVVAASSGPGTIEGPPPPLPAGGSLGALGGGRLEIVDLGAVTGAGDAAGLAKPSQRAMRAAGISGLPVLPNAREDAQPAGWSDAPIELARPKPSTGAQEIRPKPRLAIVKLAGGVAVVAIIGVAAFLTKGRAPEPAAAAPTAAAPSTEGVLVNLDVTPRPDRLLIDGAPVPSNPVRLPQGAVRTVAAFADGYEPAETVVVADKAKTVTLKLVRARKK